MTETNQLDAFSKGFVRSINTLEIFTFATESIHPQMTQSKKVIFLFFVVFASIRAIGQTVTFSDLQILYKKDLHGMNSYLLGRKWEFQESETQDIDDEVDEYYSETALETVIWTYQNPNFKQHKVNNLMDLLYLKSNPVLGSMVRINYADHHTLVFITNKSKYQAIEREVINSGYTKTASEADEPGLKTTYQRGNMIVVFLIGNKSGSMALSDEVRYSIGLTDISYKVEQEARLEALRQAEFAEQLRLQQEAEAAALKQAQLAEEERLKEIKIDSLTRLANNAFDNKDFASAKSRYAEVIKLADYSYQAESRLKEIEEIEQFLSTRMSKIYDYREINRDLFDSYKLEVLSYIRNHTSLGNINGTIDFRCKTSVDVKGLSKVEFSLINSSSDELTSICKKASESVQIRSLELHGYQINAKGEYTFHMSRTTTEVTCRKSPENIDVTPNVSVDVANIPEIKNGLNGKYEVAIVNYTDDVTSTVVSEVKSFSGKGGVGNVFLSILVPGLGDSPVSYGKNSGVGTMICTLGLIGGGFGSFSYSKSEYKLYHSATSQSEMDKHYDNANTFNKFGYVCLAAGAALWLYDIVWVMDKGVKNSKANSRYKSSLSLGVLPSGVAGFTFKLAFK